MIIARWSSEGLKANVRANECQDSERMEKERSKSKGDMKENNFFCDVASF